MEGPRSLATRPAEFGFGDAGAEVVGDEARRGGAGLGRRGRERRARLGVISPIVGFLRRFAKIARKTAKSLVAGDIARPFWPEFFTLDAKMAGLFIPAELAISLCLRRLRPFFGGRKP